jgi:orotate phosphoribosyltransferase
MVTMHNDLLNLISAREGHFRLESGYHGGLWLDLDPLFVSPARLQPFMDELGTRIARHGVDAVCGPLTGGAFLAQSLAAALGLEFYCTERFLSPNPADLYPFGYRLPDALCKHVRGKSVAIVDDVISAGSAVRGTFTALQACGAVPACMGALLVLGTQAATFCAGHNIPLEQLGQMEYNLWMPSECPLCASGVPLEDSGNTLAK